VVLRAGRIGEVARRLETATAASALDPAQAVADLAAIAADLQSIERAGSRSSRQQLSVVPPVPATVIVSSREVS